jgi:phosphoribosylanthranilate isomerase
MTKIKFCGLSRHVDIDYVNELLPDYIGFVFYEKSKRNVSFETAKSLKKRLDKKIKAVGVFVDKDISFITNLVDSGVIDIVQLHGNEDDAYIFNLRKAVNIPIIKAFKIKSQEDISFINSSSADCVLLDSGMGTGKAFDWSLISGIKRDFFLAGGLNLENISEALNMIKPFAIDVSSGIETDGYKDFDKMKQFMTVTQDT